MELDTKWRQYEQQLGCLTHLKIPQRIVIDGAKIIEMHGFSDASQHAYGACVYLRHYPVSVKLRFV